MSFGNQLSAFAFFWKLEEPSSAPEIAHSLVETAFFCNTFYLLLAEDLFA